MYQYLFELHPSATATDAKPLKEKADAEAPHSHDAAGAAAPIHSQLSGKGADALSIRGERAEAIGAAGDAGSVAGQEWR